MNTNLLDLNNDILNIIGDYVKKDKSMKYPSRPNLRKFIYYTFSLIEVKNEEIINEYLTLKKLNLKYH